MDGPFGRDLDKLELRLCDDDPIELSLHGEEHGVKGYPRHLTGFFNQNGDGKSGKSKKLDWDWGHLIPCSTLSLIRKRQT